MTRADTPSCRPIFWVALIVAVCVFVVYKTTPADAAKTRVLQRTFGAATSTVTDPAPLSNPQGIGVDQSSEAVYVADAGNHRVEKFGPKGEFLLAFGKDVNETNLAKPNVCTAVQVGLGEKCQAGTSDSTPGAFENPQFVAVDNDPGSASFHDVYVADTKDNIVSKFNDEGELVASWGVGGQANGACEKEQELLPCAGSTLMSFTELRGIAVGPTGTLAVLNRLEEPHQLFELEQDGGSGTHFEIPRESAADGLAMNAGGDFFKVTGSTEIVEIGPAGSEVGVIAPEGSSGPIATAPDGDVYSAGLAGTLNHYEFNGGGEVAQPGGGTCALVPEGAGCSPTDSTGVGFEGSGIGVNAGGDPFLSNGTEADVWELGSSVVTVPDAVTGAASVQPTSVTLSGMVNPEEVQLKSCEFEYVEASKYDASALNPYAEGSTAACEAPSAAEIGLVNEEENVHATLASLQHGTTYDYRLIARNENDESSPLPAVGVNNTFETFPPPSIDSATVTDLSASSATLNASINPGSLQTEWHFEWDERPYLPGEGAHGHSTEVKTILAGSSDVAVKAKIEGLKPDTHYYWRVVASSEAGTTLGVGHTFVYTADGEGLPDGRAYEMVSPPRKNGALLGDVSFVGVKTDVAAGGQRVMAMAIQCFAGAESCNAANENAIGSPYEFTRTSDAGVCAPAPAPCWHTTAVAPSASEFTGVAPAAQAYSAQNGTVLFSIPTGPSLGGNGENDFFVRELSGSLVHVGPDTPAEDGARGPVGGQFSGREQAHTADFSHFAWDAPYFWTAPFEEDIHKFEVLEYAGVGASRPLQVGVAGGEDSESLVSTCGTDLGTGAPNVFAPGSMSADGRTVFFTAESSGGASCLHGAYGEVPANELFARVDGESADAHTVAISEPSAASPAAPYPGCEEEPCIGNVNDRGSFAGADFVGAPEDGSRAFFLSTQQLTDRASQYHDSQTNHGQVGNMCVETVAPDGCNLYEFEGVTGEHVGERHLVDVSEGEGGMEVSGGPRVQGVLTVSPQATGQRVYFVAKGVLTSTERPGCMAEWAAVGRGGEAVCHAIDGEDNLYAYSQESHSVSFVTVMSPRDVTEWAGEPGKPVNVTPDGRFLVFLSRSALTADDTSRSGAYQVFRFDAQTGGLVRVSAGDTGFDDDGNRSTVSPCIVPSEIVCSEDAGIVVARRQSRPDPTMSDDGSRVFFESPVALTGHALDDVQVADAEEIEGAEGVNAKLPIYAQNVYEWEAAGVGSCPLKRSAGCVFLVSDGRDVSVNRGANSLCAHGSSVCLLGTDTEGRNVFIATTEQLTSSDTNTELDYYDARVCEPGNPCVQPPAPSSPGCSGEECHGAPASTPGVPAAPTTTFKGQGNAPPASTPLSKAETRAQKLTRALATCRHRYKKKARRKRCEAQARVKYDAKTKKAKRVDHNRRAGR